jgi:hypothetical protein
MSAKESGISANLLLPDDEGVAKATVIQKGEEGEEEEEGRSSTVDGALDVSILKGRVDSYKGIIVEPSSLPVDVPTFERCLKASLQQWRQEVWLSLTRKLGIAICSPEITTYVYEFCFILFIFLHTLIKTLRWNFVKFLTP